VVAKRVWTTDCSFAKSSAIVSSAAAATGESGTAVTATVATLPLSPSSVRRTSVVVPEREMATTRP